PADLDRIAASMPAAAIEAIYPLTPVQHGLVFHSQYQSDGPDVYAVQQTMSLAGRLDERRLQRAAAALLRRHDALRVSFAFGASGQLMQVVHREPRAAWSSEDLRSFEGPTQRSALDALLETERDARFVLEQAPLPRWLTVRLSDSDYVLALTSHHAI